MTQSGSSANAPALQMRYPPQCSHLRWYHPGRKVALVHCLPVKAFAELEAGLVSFTSGIDRKRTEFHGYYEFVRGGLDPEGTREPATLHLRFKYWGEPTGQEIVDHVLVATHNGENCVTFRDTKLWVVAELVGLPDIWKELVESDLRSRDAHAQDDPQDLAPQDLAQGHLAHLD